MTLSLRVVFPPTSSVPLISFTRDMFQGLKPHRQEAPPPCNLLAGNDVSNVFQCLDMTNKVSRGCRLLLLSYRNYNRDKVVMYIVWRWHRLPLGCLV
jgi:hypothetical protein